MVEIVDYNILTENVPLGGTAVANLNTFQNSAPEDVTSVRTIWKDHLGVTIVDATRTATDVSGTGVHGEAFTITDVSGIGTYKATLFIINNGTYSPSASGLTWTLRAIITDEDGSADKTFEFKIVPSSITVSLDTSQIISAIKRQGGMTEDIVHMSNADEKTSTIDVTPAKPVVSLAGKRIIYNIDEAFKNGLTIVRNTDYYWKEGRPFVTITPAPVVGDFFLFRCQTRLSTTAIEDYITSATREVISMLQPFYDDLSLAAYPTVANLIKDLALGKIKQDLSEGVALESAYYRSGRDTALAVITAVEEIARGERDIIKGNNTVLARKKGSIVGGFRHADGALTERKDIRDRLAAFDGFAYSFYPFDKTNVKGSA